MQTTVACVAGLLVLVYGTVAAAPITCGEPVFASSNPRLFPIDRVTCVMTIDQPGTGFVDAVAQQCAGIDPRVYFSA
ncbi:MAG: hypothetical protein ACTHLW_13150 [Verrucomicrobiota bacterium]